MSRIIRAGRSDITLAHGLPQIYCGFSSIDISHERAPL